MKREVLEETGLSTLVVRKLGERDYKSEPKLKHRKSLIVYLLRSTDQRFQVTLSKEHDGYRWVAYSDVNSVFGLGDLMGGIVREYFESDSRAHSSEQKNSHV